MDTCAICGVTITRKELSPEAAQWRGRKIIWLDPYNAARTTGLNGHDHSPKES